MEKWAFNGFFTKGQLHRYAQAIPFRKSCRNYSSAPDFNQWSHLSYAAGRVCLPGIRIVLAHCEESFFTSPFLGLGRITGATRFAALLAKNTLPYAQLYGGVSGEAFVLEAQSIGVDTCWVEETYRKNENPVIPQKDEKVLAVIALGKGTVQAVEAVPVKRKKKLFSKADKVDTSFWPKILVDTLDFIDAAPSAMNKKPWSVAFNPPIFSIQSKVPLDLGIALLHSEAGLFTAQRQWSFSQNSFNEITLACKIEENAFL